VVTAEYRDPQSSKAHARGAIDIRAAGRSRSRLKEAQKISAALSNNDVLVLVEEVSQDQSGGKS